MSLEKCPYFAYLCPKALKDQELCNGQDIEYCKIICLAYKTLERKNIINLKEIPKRSLKGLLTIEINEIKENKEKLKEILNKTKISDIKLD